MPATPITNVLPEICAAGKLVAVENALFDRDPSFITAIRLTFESYSVLFRAVPGDDTIMVADSDPFPQSDEVVVTVTANPPWAGCVGRKVTWAWLLTNQQGYEDGIRLEFESEASGVALVVMGSSIKLYAFAAVA